MLLLARFSGIWEIFLSFTALSFTSSEVDELEKLNCSAKLGISSFVSMIELQCKQTLGKKCRWLAVTSAFYILSSKMVF